MCVSVVNCSVLSLSTGLRGTSSSRACNKALKASGAPLLFPQFFFDENEQKTDRLAQLVRRRLFASGTRIRASSVSFSSAIPIVNRSVNAN